MGSVVLMSLVYGCLALIAIKVARPFLHRMQLADKVKPETIIMFQVLMAAFATVMFMAPVAAFAVGLFQMLLG